MADELANGKSSLSPERARSGVSSSETIESSQWDQLLAKLGLTERQALNAIVLDSEIGRSIRGFVQDSGRAHFVPEDVLLALNLHLKLMSSADDS